MAQDLMGTISTLQAMAVGNCRKRIEDAALRARGIVREPQDADAERARQRPACGVTSVLKSRHGL